MILLFKIFPKLGEFVRKVWIKWKVNVKLIIKLYKKMEKYNIKLH
jgi:hypothetical protein